MRPALGAFVEVGARGECAPEAIDTAFAMILRAQALWSFHDPSSELSRLNAARGQPVALDPETVRLLRIARALTFASDARFDCTVGGELVRRGVLPDHGGETGQPRGNAGDIELGPGWARLCRPIRVTLDGIAKGYAVDLAIRALRRQGAEAGWVNAGGDLRVFGPLSLPVQRREFDGSMAPLGSLCNAALASSRALDDADEGVADAFPGRIIAPVGCEPARGVWSVLARSAWRADALTKVAATAPESLRATLVCKLGGHLVGSAVASGLGSTP